MHREFTCITCPMGCRLQVDGEKDNYIVTGNTCKRGEVYAISEMTEAKRTITTSVKIEKANSLVVPIKTNKPVPKDKIFEIMKVINSLVIEAPVKIGDVIVKDILNTGSDLVITKNIDRI